MMTAASNSDGRSRAVAQGFSDLSRSSYSWEKTLFWGFVGSMVVVESEVGVRMDEL